MSGLSSCLDSSVGGFSSQALYDNLGQPAPSTKPNFETVREAEHESALPGVVPSSSSDPPCAPNAVGPGGHPLTADQRSELAMAKRRALKAANGKRTRMLSRLVEGPDADGGDEELDIQKHSDEIEARIAGMDDEKEAKRLKRLLRNRISAQQARERKKTYMNSLEARAAEKEAHLCSMEERVRQLECENKVLRTIIKNMSANGQAPPAMVPQ